MIYSNTSIANDIVPVQAMEQPKANLFYYYLSVAVPELAARIQKIYILKRGGITKDICEKINEIPSLQKLKKILKKRGYKCYIELAGTLTMDIETDYFRMMLMWHDEMYRISINEVNTPLRIQVSQYNTERAANHIEMLMYGIFLTIDKL